MDSIKKELQEKKQELQKEFSEKKEQLEKKIETGVVKAKRFTRRLLWSVAGLITIGIIGFFLWANYTYSEGTRSGNLIKISKKGYIFKTYEGQLKLGGIDLQNEEEGLSDTWSFSVKNINIVRQLEKLQGEKVILRYKEINKAMPWQGDTNYFVTDVEQKE
ncbi:MAG TPA: hypothetical protein ENJ20_06360 [Bacteroidetes bacterium]|nr:hypothetical protein [Bacteroidota bacterium]